MKIAIDSWTLASRFRCQGTYVYLQNLLREFKQIAEHNAEVEFSLFASARNGNDAARMSTSQSFTLQDSRLLDHDRLWRLGGAGLSAMRSRADVFFIPTAATLPLGNTPSVCTIHDATPLTMPTHSGHVTALQRIAFKSCARFSRAVITSSECSKDDIVRLLGVPEEKVTVIYDACDHNIFNTEPADTNALQALKKQLGIQRPYLIHHGTIQPRKNLKRLIQAFRLMLAQEKDFDFDLVLAGQMGWSSEEVVAAAQATSSHRGNVILAGTPTDAELALLLKGASLAVIPSFYEGFSLPMVEAMACGAPTIAAQTSCLPEISGNALVYFDPLSIDDMAACIRSVLLNSELGNGIREKGLARAREFSWERCARETIEVLTRVGRAGS
jgi:glycosyltransferase involved in cell wall biosynthesis